MTVGQLIKGMFGGLTLPSINILNVLFIIFGILAIVAAYFSFKHETNGWDVITTLWLLVGLALMFLGCWNLPIDIALGIVSMSFVIFILCVMQTIRKED